MTTQAIKAIVFDFDGTMLDTEGAIFRSWQETYRSYDQIFAKEDWAEVVGKDALTFDPMDRLEQLVGDRLDRQNIEEKRLARQTELIESLPLQPGVASLIEDAKKRSMKLAIASNSDMAWVAGHLTRLGILNEFQTICTRDQVNHAKPHPELYAVAARRLRIRPREAVAIEDSPTGALAGIRAGMPTVVVPIELTEGRTFPPEAILLTSLKDVGIDQLTRMVRQDVPR